ncbi:ACP S-malonyltransferase [Candidatus Pelagibacter sp.]|nr:ACP S-malonyltransferase [Candidatus Pelagibacter sp.]
MFSVIFPGQGSQIVGMGKDFFEKHDIVKKLFKEADETLEFSLSKLILDGPKDKLDLTINTQPAIFLISYSIFQVVKQDFDINLNKAKYFAGHSLGEYSALSCAGYLNFNETIKTLRVRGDAMQNSVPKGEGGMLAVLGLKIEDLEKILQDNQNVFDAEVANDNSDGQIVLSGKTKDLQILSQFLKEKKIKNIKLPVSAPFHCNLMSKATEVMTKELQKINFKQSKNILISNVTANEISHIEDLKGLLIKQIEKRVRWRETILYMINKGVSQFIEIGPGKVLSGLVKRINKDVKISSINSQSDIESLNI